MDFDDVYLSIDQGIPCGLFLNELISNVYKHAFSETGEGKLKVLFKESHGFITLEFKDDGNGLPDDFSAESNTSLRLILIKTLSAQIKVGFKIDTSGSGSTFTITFQKETVSELTENPVYN